MAIVEITTFRPKPGREGDVLAADRRVQVDFAYRQPGLVRRTTARGGHRWVVVELWATEAAADDAARRRVNDVGWSELAALVDDVTTERFSTLE